jgi:hypothetical protein
MLGITLLFPCEVECVSSARYGERPTAIIFENKCVEIKEIVKSWRSPSEICFQVLTNNRQAFELSYNEASDQWSCTII